MFLLGCVIREGWSPEPIMVEQLGGIWPVCWVEGQHLVHDIKGVIILNLREFLLQDPLAVGRGDPLELGKRVDVYDIIWIRSHPPPSSNHF